MDAWIPIVSSAITAAVVASIPSWIAWIRGRRKDVADTAAVLVDTSSDVVDILRSELDRAILNIDKLTRQIVGMNERIVNFERERQQYEDTLRDFVLAIEGMRITNEMQTREIGALKTRIASLESERDALRGMAT
jgi:chromosome segregation ATPase